MIQTLAGSTYWLDGCNNTNWQDQDCNIDSSDSVCDLINSSSPQPCQDDVYISNISINTNDSKQYSASASTCSSHTNGSNGGLLSFNGDDTGGGSAGCLDMTINGSSSQFPAICAWGTSAASGGNLQEMVTVDSGKLVFKGEGSRIMFLDPDMTDDCVTALTDTSYDKTVSSMDKCASNILQLDISNCTIDFDVYLEGTMSGCDLAFYFVNTKHMVDNNLSGTCGDYYCDANANYSVCNSCNDRAGSNEYVFCTENRHI